MFDRLQDNTSFILAAGGKEGKKSRCSNSYGRVSPSTQIRGTAYLLPGFLILPITSVSYQAALALAPLVSSAPLCFCLKTFSSWPTSSACFLVCSRGFFFPPSLPDIAPPAGSTFSPLCTDLSSHPHFLWCAQY